MAVATESPLAASTFAGASGWSQEAFAARVGIHRTYMGSVERGERNLAIDNICRIAWALGVRSSELLKE
jgi:transcriptional regulator with XRE-family HTH domain